MKKSYELPLNNTQISNQNIIKKKKKEVASNKQISNQNIIKKKKKQDASNDTISEEDEFKIITNEMKINNTLTPINFARFQQRYIDDNFKYIEFQNTKYQQKYENEVRNYNKIMKGFNETKIIKKDENDDWWKEQMDMWLKYVRKINEKYKKINIKSEDKIKENDKLIDETHYYNVKLQQKQDDQIYKWTKEQMFKNIK